MFTSSFSNGLDKLADALVESLPDIPETLYCTELKSAHLTSSDAPDLFSYKTKSDGKAAFTEAAESSTATPPKKPNTLLPVPPTLPKAPKLASPLPPPPVTALPPPPPPPAAKAAPKASPKAKSKALNHVEIVPEGTITLGRLEVVGEPFFARCDSGADAHVAGKELAQHVQNTRVSALPAVVPLSGRVQQFREGDVELLTEAGPIVLKGAAVSPKTNTCISAATVVTDANANGSA